MKGHRNTALGNCKVWVTHSSILDCAWIILSLVLLKCSWNRASASLLQIFQWELKYYQRQITHSFNLLFPLLRYLHLQSVQCCKCVSAVSALIQGLKWITIPGLFLFCRVSYPRAYVMKNCIIWVFPVLILTLRWESGRTEVGTHSAVSLRATEKCVVGTPLPQNSCPIPDAGTGKPT